LIDRDLVADFREPVKLVGDEPVTRDVVLSLNAGATRRRTRPRGRINELPSGALRVRVYSGMDPISKLSGGCTSPRSYRQGRRPVTKLRRCAPGSCTRLTRNAIRAPEPPSANSSTDCFYAIWTDAPTRMKLAAAESSVSIQVRPIDVVRAVTQTVTRGDDQLDGTGRCREASGSGPLPRHADRNPDWAICWRAATPES
jgi:hypothetical protein